LTTSPTTAIPRDRDDDYTRAAAEARREFARERTGATLEHIGSFSFDPAQAKGNIEHFTGVAHIPLGIAGPLLVHGEHAEGEFYIPLATSEGTLVASYNRGMKLVREAGGATVTVLDDAMQRAPAFGFDSAREARDFGRWVEEHFDELREQAEATTSVGRLCDIEQYGASRFRYLRFNYTTGDGAGQNMAGKATAAACAWIRERYDGIRHFQLEANFATDKKHSHVNTLHTRGKRVVAEVTIPPELM
jgi:hydroxymethylglutaryl-CoA reductase (NADPH)